MFVYSVIGIMLVCIGCSTMIGSVVLIGKRFIRGESNNTIALLRLTTIMLVCAIVSSIGAMLFMYSKKENAIVVEKDPLTSAEIPEQTEAVKVVTDDITKELE